MKAYDVPGLSNNKDLDIVYEWARTVPENGVIVELGSFFGRTAVAFAEGAYSSVKIYCIDYFDEWLSHFCENDAPGGSFWEVGKVYNKEQEFLKNTKDYKNINLLKLKEGQIVYPYDKEPIDILFVDALHKNPSDIINIMFFKKFVKRDGMICGHDYYEDKRFPDVGMNISILEKMFNTTATLYKGSSMWSIRIKE
jgi:hypothetical protein